MVPNLDDMPRDDLFVFVRRYTRPTRRDAAELIGDRRRGYTRIASSLGFYAVHRMESIRHRLEGRVAAAERHDGRCEEIYRVLPADLRW